MKHPEPGEDADPLLGAPGAIRAPLLAALLDRGGSSRRRVIADLGTLQPGMLDALSQSRTRLVVADLPGRRAENEDDWDRLDAALPRRHWREPLAAVLCWDLLNYLDAGRLAALAEALRERAAPDCRVHALIHYSALEMPGAPGQIRIDPNLDLRIPSLADTRPIATPRYTPKALEKAMPALVVERTMLLGNGMQEFTFRVHRPN